MGRSVCQVKASGIIQGMNQGLGKSVGGPNQPMDFRGQVVKTINYAQMHIQKGSCVVTDVNPSLKPSVS